MPQRFEYVRMTLDELDKRLADLNMGWLTFVRIIGQSSNARTSYERGKPIPIYYGLILHLFENAPGSLPEARQWAAENIIRDNTKPERGEFPYLEPEGD